MREPAWCATPTRRRRDDEEAGPYVSGCLSCVVPLGWVLLILALGALGAYIGGGWPR